MAAKKTKAAAPSGAVFVLAGSDEAAVKKRASELAGTLVPPDAGEFARDVIDGCADGVDQAAARIHETAQALLTLPFFGGGKLVWLKNVNFLSDDVKGRSSTVIEALDMLQTTLASGLPEGVKFLLSAVDVDKRRAFYKSLAKCGSVEVFDQPDASRAGWETEAAAAVERSARGRGLRFREDALELFTLLTGGESRQVENELEKIELFLGAAASAAPREVLPGIVRQLVPLSRAGVVFELGHAISQRELPRGLALIEQLLAQGETAVGILLAAIVPTVRSLLLVKDLMQRHRLSPPQTPWQFTATLNRLPPSATEHLPRKKDGTLNAFALGAAAKNAHRFSLAELRALLAGCLRANVQLVTTSLDGKLVLSELIAAIAPQETGGHAFDRI